MRMFSTEKLALGKLERDRESQCCYQCHPKLLWCHRRCSSLGLRNQRALKNGIYFKKFGSNDQRREKEIESFLQDVPENWSWKSLCGTQDVHTVANISSEHLNVFASVNFWCDRSNGFLKGFSVRQRFEFLYAILWKRRMKTWAA